MSTEQDSGIVRLEIPLSAEEFKALKRLQQLTGKSSPAETVRSALQLYGVVEKNGVLQIPNSPRRFQSPLFGLGW